MFGPSIGIGRADGGHPKIRLASIRTGPYLVVVRRSMSGPPINDKEYSQMERKQRLRVLDTMNAIERARAQEGMHQAMHLADLTLALVSRIRNALDSAGQAMTLAYGRTRS
jgi:hypothetical protein